MSFKKDDELKNEEVFWDETFDEIVDEIKELEELITQTI